MRWESEHCSDYQNSFSFVRHTQKNKYSFISVAITFTQLQKVSAERV